MSDSLWLIAAAFSTVLAMAWLALSLKNHWEQVFPQPGNNPHALRLRSAGTVFLFLSGICCLIADHPSMAALVWIMLLPLSAVLIAMTLSRYPHLLQWVCPTFFVERTL